MIRKYDREVDADSHFGRIEKATAEKELTVSLNQWQYQNNMEQARKEPAFRISLEKRSATHE
ncbi:hypothetical protein ABD75_17485 [Bacillus vallismortis]|nr:hypothetical protein [Bacillus vallismortis]QAV10732.1 hypothetical protein BV11031_20390 [Bacillus vallismortis]